MASPAAIAETAAGADGQQQQQRQGGGGGGSFSAPPHLMSNLFHKGEPLDMWFYLSEKNDKFNDFSNDGALVWHETNIPYAVWKPESTRTFSMKYYPSEALKNNGSLYAHVFFARSGFPIDPNDPESVGNPKDDSAESKAKVEEVDDGHDSELKDEGPVEWISYWKPNVTINLVDDFTRYPQHGVPPNIAPYIQVEPTTVNYYPTVFFNEFWLLRDKLIAINETVSELPLNIEVHRSYGSMLDGESDELKRVFLEGNPYLLGITMCVSMLHSVFDFLAFKNDIQFWNKNKSMEGLSAKSVVLNFICQFIIFLYLLDNDTSWMILASSGVGVCIEFWKIGKAMRIEVDRSGMIPRLRFHDRESYARNKTKEYDDMAIKFLSYVLLLLVAGFAIYSLAYERHKSWYSWILSSLTSCVYMFIMMCPQLFINYKLKSVAHLPWRQMTYKFLNTIIDDLFAFVIKMPMLHRLSVFRDDVIFLIYLYQRWVYPVDKTRVNEFGFGGEDESVDPKKITDQEDDKKTN
ncbi:Transmembrane CLPTM1 family protein [Raphanus sativus]|nr:Transmembrane CLPTM1 family protein [Raphanus sativus]